MNPNPYTIRAAVADGGDIIAEAPSLTGANTALRTLREEGYTDLRGPSYEPDRESDVPDVEAAGDETRWCDGCGRYHGTVHIGGGTMLCRLCTEDGLGMAS